VTLGLLHVALGLPHVTLGLLHVILGLLNVTLGLPRVTLGLLHDLFSSDFSSLFLPQNFCSSRFSKFIEISGFMVIYFLKILYILIN
jgi:hypothetical protein